MMKQNKRVKIVVSSLATIFLILLYVIIFFFSAQDGETSGGLSMMVSEEVVSFLNTAGGNKWTIPMVLETMEIIESILRKLAHFCEYMIMGMLVFGVWYPWILDFKKCAKIVIPWVFVSAAFDEIHQLFVPDRWASFWDVLLDTSGGCAGLWLGIMLVKYIRKDKAVKHHQKRSPKASFRK